MTNGCPQNILIHRKPPEDDAWWVVLGDLGLSRRSGASSGTTTVRGTPSFMAPEAIGRPFLGHPNDADPFPADMWCLGETISCALTGHSTFSDNEQLLQYQKRRVRFPDDALKQSSASTDAIDFIRCLMEVDPLQRLTAAQALNHAWIKVNHTPHTHTTKTIASNSLRDIKPVFSTSTKNFDMETVVVNRELPIRDQITQASAQWTQTVPIRLNDAKAPVKSVETISSAPRTSPNLSVKRKVLRRTPDIEIVKKIEAPALDQYQDYRDLMPSSAEQRLDTQRDYHVLASYADYDTLGSSRRFAAAERLPTVPSRSPLTSKDKRVRWADLENSDKESTLSTSAQTGLRPNPSNKKEPSRREEVPDLQHALRHYFETGQWYGIDPRALKEGQNSSLSRSQTWIPESGPPPEFAPPSEFGSPPRSPGDKHDHSDPPTPTPVQIPPPLLATKVQRHLHVPAIDINVSGNPLRLQPQLKTISRANTETGKSAQPSDSAQKKDKKQSADSHGQVHGRSTLTEAWNKYMTQFAKDREPEERKTRSRRS
jgi:serine/threonine protein kinase